MIVAPLLIAGFGVGCVFQPVLVALQAHSPKARRAVIISNRNFFRCAGGACGLAVSAAVLQATLRVNLPLQYAYLARDTYALPHLQGADKSMVLDAYMAASRAVFLMQIPIIGTCLLGCIFVKDRGLQPAEDGELINVTEGKSWPDNNASSASRDMLESDGENTAGGKTADLLEQDRKIATM